MVLGSTCIWNIWFLFGLEGITTGLSTINTRRVFCTEACTLTDKFSLKRRGEWTYPRVFPGWWCTLWYVLCKYLISRFTSNYIFFDNIQYIHIWFLLPGLCFKGLVFWFVIKSAYLTYSSHHSSRSPPGKIYMMSCRGVLFSRTSGSPPFRSNWDVLGRSSLDCVHPRRLYGLEPEVMMVWLEDDFPISRGAGILSFLPLIFRGVDRKGCWLFCCVLFFFPGFLLLNE